MDKMNPSDISGASKNIVSCVVGGVKETVGVLLLSVTLGGVAAYATPAMMPAGEGTTVTEGDKEYAEKQKQKEEKKEKKGRDCGTSTTGTVCTDR